MTGLQVALGHLDVPGLFTACIEEFDVVVTSRNPNTQFTLLCTKFFLQRRRFVTWAEALRLVPSTDDGPSTPPHDAKDMEDQAGINPILKQHFINLVLILADADVFIETFQFNCNDALPREVDNQRAIAAPVGLRLFQEHFEACRERVWRRNRKTDPVWSIKRWSVHNPERFAAVVDEVASLLDTLEDVKTGPRIVRDQSPLTQEEIEVMAEQASLRLQGPAIVGTDMSSVGQDHRDDDGLIGQADLCQPCRHITLSMLVNGFRHALDFDQVQRSKASCRFCALLSDAYSTQTCIRHDTASCDKVHRGRLQWGLQNIGPGVRFGLFKLDSRHYGEGIRIYSSEESTLFKSGIFTQRRLLPAHSPRNIRLLRDWLDQCLSEHGECQRGRYSAEQYDDIPGSSTLPFRVIDVGASDGSQVARLVTTSSRMKGRYLTLSHCWGKIMPTMTTKATVLAWHAALPYEELSKTFQDAIHLTRDLGERFLWIDSLCIVQDDPGDLDAQIGLMGTIFEASYCTIVAVDAKGPEGALPDRGLFLSGRDNVMPRLWVRHQPPAADPPSGGKPRDMGAAQSSQSTPMGDERHPVFMETVRNQVGPFSSQLQEKAWNSRGWVYQEKELSRRCIFYTEETVAWRCARYWETEQTGARERREKASAVQLETTTSGGVTYGIDHAMKKLWQRVIEEYSQKKLTYVSDKAKAITGIEERLAARLSATFRFGLLDFGPREVLLSQILWLPVTARSGARRGDSRFPYPSWSWMVVDGSVRWAANEYVMHSEALAEVDYSQAATGGQQQLLRLSGPCQNIKIGTTIDQIPHHTRFERWPPEMHFGWTELALGSGTNLLLSTTSDEIIGWVILDTSEQQPGEITAWPLLQHLRLDDEIEVVCIDFVALARLSAAEASAVDCGGLDAYCRVGRGRVLKSALAWLERCRQHHIVVV